MQLEMRRLICEGASLTGRCAEGASKGATSPGDLLGISEKISIKIGRYGSRSCTFVTVNFSLNAQRMHEKMKLAVSYGFRCRQVIEFASCTYFLSV